MTKEEWIKQQDTDDNFGFRLASINSCRTGLPTTVWVDVMEPGVNEIPRLIFTDSLDGTDPYFKWLPMTLDKENPDLMIEGVIPSLPTSDIETIKQWIIVHYDELMDVWNCSISHCDFIINNYLKNEYT